MRFILLFGGSDAAWNTLNQDTIDRLAAAHREVQSDLAKTGELVDHSELALSDAAVLTVLDGERVLAKGPSASGGHIVSGYYILDCRDLDRAIEIAGRFVEVEFAQIEVRRISRTNTWEDGAACIAAHQMRRRD